MRNLLIVACVICITTANAQLTISAKGGWNSTTAHVIKSFSPSKYQAHQGWQSGLQATYRFKNWLLYAGSQADKKYFFYKEDNGDKIGKYYKPTFLTLPAGVGYNFAVAKGFGLRLYTGFYISRGIGGKYYADQYAISTYPPYFCDPGACPETFDIVDRKMRFGNHATSNTPDDLTRTNWGTEFGLGILARQRFELMWMYDLGMSNILPPDLSNDDHRLRGMSLDLKVNLKTFTPTAKK